MREGDVNKGRGGGVWVRKGKTAGYGDSDYDNDTDRENYVKDIENDNGDNVGNDNEDDAGKK